MYGETDILTDKGSKAYAASKLDMAIPLAQSGELGEIMKRINELTQELSDLTQRANHIYAHGYVSISIDSVSADL